MINKLKRQLKRNINQLKLFNSNAVVSMFEGTVVMSNFFIDLDAFYAQYCRSE